MAGKILNSNSEKKSKKNTANIRKKSGINAKASDKVRNPQKGPRTHLQYEHVISSLYLTTLILSCLSPGNLISFLGKV